MRRLLAAVFVAVFVFACAAPAAAEDGYVDLVIEATLDQTAYLSTDVVTMQVIVSNIGTATATGVVVRADGDLAFAPWGEPADIPPQGHMELTVTAAPNDSGDGMAERLEAVSSMPDHNPADNVATVESFVTVEHADLAVTLYGDADRDGVVDPGETRAGVLVTLSGSQDGEDITARTDAAGVARFPGIAGGAYAPMVSVPKGWYLDAMPPIRIRAGNNTALLRATLSDLSTLSASVSFDRASYVPGDTMQERVTLTNSGAADLTGLVAHCGEWPADVNVLTSAGWGDLAPDGAGVTVRAGETRTWVFTDVVPPQAEKYGFVLLWCDFSPARGSDGPAVEALASVPGGHGTATGTVVDEAEKPLAGIRFLMVDKVSGVVAAQGVSDGTGFLQFSDLPAGLYDLRPTGPWRVDGTDFVIQVRAEEAIDYTPIVLMPGPVQGEPPVLKSTVDTPPVPAPVPAPAPQASPRPANLAYTGVDVAPLIALGFLLVVAGALALRVRRRNCV